MSALRITAVLQLFTAKNIAMHVLTTVITRIFLTSLSLFKLHFIDFFPLFSYPVDTGSRQSRVRKKGEFYVSK
jgi:hypothetical protein